MMNANSHLETRRPRRTLPLIFLLQWFGNVVLLILAAAWLQIADSHVWEFVLSIVAAVIIVCAFLWLHTRTFRIARQPLKPAPYLLSAVFLLVIAGVWMLLTHPIYVHRGMEYRYAGYWTSRLSPRMRNYFTYQGLYEFIDYFFYFVDVLLAAILLPIAVETMAAGVSRSTLRRLGSAYSDWLFWVLALVVAPAAIYLTERVLGWTPGNGVRGELISAGLRVGFCYTVDVLLWSVLIAIVGRRLSRAD